MFDVREQLCGHTHWRQTLRDLLDYEYEKKSQKSTFRFGMTVALRKEMYNKKISFRSDMYSLPLSHRNVKKQIGLISLITR